MQTTETTMTANGRAVGARSKAPVFVLGCPRSGTTLLYHMLLSAGNFVVYRAESQVFNLLEPRFGDLSIARNKRKLLQTWEDSALFTKTGLEASAVEAEVMGTVPERWRFAAHRYGCHGKKAGSGTLGGNDPRSPGWRFAESRRPFRTRW